MSNDFFRFKQFDVKQDMTAMKVGVDSVLLGAWADVDHACRILDVGTGTGLLALMMAQRNAEAVVDAVEIDTDACRQARQNIAGGPWPERIRVVCDDFRNFADTCSFRYDLIICNPPFFTDSLKSTDEKRNAARHNDSLPHSDLLSGAAKLLAPSGRLAVVLPPAEARLLIDKAKAYTLFPRRILEVSSFAGKPPRIMLVELSRYVCPADEKTLYIEKVDRSDYTDEYKNLTKAFYLKF